MTDYPICLNQLHSTLCVVVGGGAVAERKVRSLLEAQAMVIHPDDFGQRWNIRFTITPVIPALIKGNLF